MSAFRHFLVHLKTSRCVALFLSVLVSVLSQCIFFFLPFTKLSVGFRLAVLTRSLFCGLLYQKEQGVEQYSSPRGEPFNLSTIKSGIAIQRAALRSVHSNLFSHASLSPKFSVPSHFCLVVNTSITACLPSRSGTFLNQSGGHGGLTFQPASHPSD